MLLDRSVAINRCHVAICLSFCQRINGVLGCVFKYLKCCLINYLVKYIVECLINYYLISYLSIIKVLYDIVPRAVNEYWNRYNKIPPPQLEQINTTIEHNRISLFDNVSYNKVRSVTIAIVSQNASSAVCILLCKILGSGVVYAE